MSHDPLVVACYAASIKEDLKPELRERLRLAAEALDRQRDQIEALAQLVRDCAAMDNPGPALRLFIKQNRKLYEAHRL